MGYRYEGFFASAGFPSFLHQIAGRLSLVCPAQLQTFSLKIARFP